MFADADVSEKKENTTKTRKWKKQKVADSKIAYQKLTIPYNARDKMPISTN